VRAEMKIALVRTFVFIGKGIFLTTAAPTHVSVGFAIALPSSAAARPAPQPRFDVPEIWEIS
jgi:hypothetical protein